jgi:hypothetical protein
VPLSTLRHWHQQGMGRHVWRLAARCGTGRLPSSDG